VYDNDAKKPDEAVGHVASPMVVTQIGGPGLNGSTVSGGNAPVLRQASTDPTGDAQARYSALFGAPFPPNPDVAVNEPGTDLTGVSILPRTGGGFTVRMSLSDLSDAALTKAMTDTGSASLLYALRFANGFQPSAVVARYSPVTGWSFVFNSHAQMLSQCLAPPSSSQEKCLAYGVSGTPLAGTVDPAHGTITIPVPPDAGGQRLLIGLAGGQGAGQRPHEVAAKVGTRFYDASVFTFGDTQDNSTVPQVQSYLYPLDNTPAMDFTIK
jgi:hypothetical protein